MKTEKRRKAYADADDAGGPPANKYEPDAATATAPRKAREKSKYVLEKLVKVHLPGGNSEGEWMYQAIDPQPDHDDTDGAIKWAQDQHLAGTLRVVVVKAVFELVTETVKKTSVKVVGQ